MWWSRGGWLFAEFERPRRDRAAWRPRPGANLSTRQRHQLDVEVKAITYHGLKVEQHGDGWLAEVIVDI